MKLLKCPLQTTVIKKQSTMNVKIRIETSSYTKSNNGDELQRRVTATNWAPKVVKVW